MRISEIKRSPLYSLMNNPCLFARGSNTLVFSNWRKNNTTLFLFSKDPSKYEYYSFAKQHKFKYIPRIYSLLHDNINHLYVVEREICNPITQDRKLARMDKIRFEVKHSQADDPVAKDILSFYFDNENSYNHEFDFGVHWLMQDDNGKLVVTDVFTDRI